MNDEQCYICGIGTEFYGQRLNTMKTKHSEATIHDIIVKLAKKNGELDAYIGREMNDSLDLNEVCSECLRQIDEYDLACVTAQQIERQLHDLLLRTKIGLSDNNSEVYSKENIPKCDVLPESGNTNANNDEQLERKKRRKNVTSEVKSVKKKKNAKQLESGNDLLGNEQLAECVEKNVSNVEKNVADNINQENSNDNNFDFGGDHFENDNTEKITDEEQRPTIEVPQLKLDSITECRKSIRNQNKLPKEKEELNELTKKPFPCPKCPMGFDVKTPLRVIHVYIYKRKRSLKNNIFYSDIYIGKEVSMRSV